MLFSGKNIQKENYLFLISIKVNVFSNVIWTRVLPDRFSRMLNVPHRKLKITTFSDTLKPNIHDKIMTERISVRCDFMKIQLYRPLLNRRRKTNRKVRPLDEPVNYRDDFSKKRWRAHILPGNVHLYCSLSLLAPLRCLVRNIKRGNKGKRLFYRFRNVIPLFFYQIEAQRGSKWNEKRDNDGIPDTSCWWPTGWRDIRADQWNQCYLKCLPWV